MVRQTPPLDDTGSNLSAPASSGTATAFRTSFTFDGSFIGRPPRTPSPQDTAIISIQLPLDDRSPNDIASRRRTKKVFRQEQRGSLGTSSGRFPAHSSLGAIYDWIRFGLLAISGGDT